MDSGCVSCLILIFQILVQNAKKKKKLPVPRPIVAVLVNNRSNILYYSDIKITYIVAVWTKIRSNIGRYCCGLKPQQYN